MNYKSKLRVTKPLTVIAAICLIFAVLLGVSGCSSDYEESINSSTYDDVSLLTMDYSELKNIKGDGFYWDSDEANLIGIRFLKLNEDGKYTFKMTDNEAVELNINISDLKRMRNEVDIVNDFIDQWSKENDVAIELPNPEEFIKNNVLIAMSIPRLKSSNIEGGTEKTEIITTSGQDWGSKTFFFACNNAISSQCHVLFYWILTGV